MIKVTRATLAIAAAVAVAATTLLAGAPAHAADDTTVDKVKSEVTRRIELRLAALTRFEASVTGAKNLTDAHQATLAALIADDRAGLTALKAKVAGETTLTALKADAKSMVDDYRIFILVGPKVRLSIAGDAEAAAIARLTTLHAKLTELVAAAKSAGKDTAAAEQDLAAMKAAVDKASADIDGKVAVLLGISPGPHPGHLGADRRSVRAGRDTQQHGHLAVDVG